MGKLFMIIGRSGVGKDTIYKNLIADHDLLLNPVVTYTTRPKRRGEEDGVEYHFVTVDRMNQLEKEGKVIEKRSYKTTKGIWYYFTINDGNVNLNSGSYLVIGTLQSYDAYKDFFFKKNGNKEKHEIEPIYVDVPDDVLHNRLILREKESEKKTHDFAELNRRFLQDKLDFTEAELNKRCINAKFINLDLVKCVAEIKRHISKICEQYSPLFINNKAYLNAEDSVFSVMTETGREINFSVSDCTYDE